MNKPESFILTDEDVPVKREIEKKSKYKRMWFMIILLVCLLTLGTVHWDFDISDIKKEKYSDEAIKAATATIMYSEQYFNGDISVETACKNISKVSDSFHAYVESLGDDATWQDETMAINISSLSLSFATESLSGGYIAEIKESVDNLKEDINY